jgi:hypothetical protein
MEDWTAKNEDKHLGGSISAGNITGDGIIVGRIIKVGNIITRP